MLRGGGGSGIIYFSRLHSGRAVLWPHHNIYNYLFANLVVCHRDPSTSSRPTGIVNVVVTCMFEHPQGKPGASPYFLEAQGCLPAVAPSGVAQPLKRPFRLLLTEQWPPNLTQTHPHPPHPHQLFWRYLHKQLHPQKKNLGDTCLSNTQYVQKLGER